MRPIPAGTLDWTERVITAAIGLLLTSLLRRRQPAFAWASAGRPLVLQSSNNAVPPTQARLRDRLASATPRREPAADAQRVLAGLIQASPLALIWLDPQGAVRQWNLGAERLFGWTRLEVLGQPVAELLDAGADSLVRIADVSRGTSFSGAETRLRTRTGDLVDVAVWTTPLGAATPRLAGTLVMIADISERVRRQREETLRAETAAVLHRLTFLAEATDRLNATLEFEPTLQRAAAVAVPELADWCTVHLLDASGTTETVAHAAANPVLEQALAELQRRYPPSREGLSPASQALRTGRSLLHAEVSHEWLAQTALDADHLQLLDRLAPVSVMGVPLIAREQTIGAMTLARTTPGQRYDAAALALAEDLARRCALAIDNARLHRETRDAVRARETFLSVASHELGGPLGRLRAYTDVLLLARARGQLDPALLHRSLRSIDRAVSRLTAVTDDMLAAARMQGGDLPLHPTRLDLGKLVREVARGYTDRLGDHHRLRLRLARGRHVVLADAARLEQVVENVLDNAVKYSPDGGDIQVSLVSEAGGVLLQVRDQGIGLPPGAAEVIFEPFGRAANAERHGVPGMGLGLYISRSIIERHGGRVWADSQGEGQGTTVSVWLPGSAAA